MKKVFIAFVCIGFSTLAVKAQAQDKKTPPMVTPAQQIAPPPPPPTPPPVDPKAGKFKFDEEVHDYGEVPEGPLAEYDFVFKNVGKKPIIITEAHGSCGCTVPSWPHEPIMPHKSAKIHVAYTTSGRPGQINKEITINSDAQQSPMKLRITGNVKPKPAEPAPSGPATK